MSFSGNVIILGFGTVAQCALPLLLDVLGLPPERFVIADRAQQSALLTSLGAGCCYRCREINRDNLAPVMGELARPGDLLINLSVGIDSIALADWCQNNGVLYLDTSIEPWEGFVEDQSVPADQRTEYALHQKARGMARDSWEPQGPTAIFSHGANPGLVSHFAKAALLEIAEEMAIEFDPPRSREDWAALARRTGTKVIHISERDTQATARAKRPGEFVNTWSIPGFIEEAMMPVELGWGTHEKTLPENGHFHRRGPRNAIYLTQLAARFLMYSWVPQGGQFLGLSLPHSESVTLSDYLSLHGKDRVVYRPTVAFVYLPCDSAFASLHEVMMRGWETPEKERVIRSDVVSGCDELGVLLLGHDLNGWWFGSQLDIEAARRLVPHSNATALQVAAGVAAGAKWAVSNPAQGYCEPEDLPHEFILDVALPYLGRIVSSQTDWHPFSSRRSLFGEPPADASDRWQLASFRAE